MWKIFELSMGDYVYKEYFSTDNELQIIWTSSPYVYMIHRKLACHFHVCENITEAKNHYIWHKKRTDYFFNNLDAKGIIRLTSKPSVTGIQDRMAKHEVEGSLLSEHIGNFTKGTISLSYHRWVEWDEHSGPPFFCG